MRHMASLGYNKLTSLTKNDVVFYENPDSHYEPPTNNCLQVIRRVDDDRIPLDTDHSANDLL